MVGVLDGRGVWVGVWVSVGVPAGVSVGRAVGVVVSVEVSDAVGEYVRLGGRGVRLIMVIPGGGCLMLGLKTRRMNRIKAERANTRRTANICKRDFPFMELSIKEYKVKTSMINSSNRHPFYETLTYPVYKPDTQASRAPG